MTVADGDRPRFAVRYAARSVPGRVRSNNEDSVHAGPRLLAVADGMGGQVGGETASAIVISVIRTLDAAPPDSPSVDSLPPDSLPTDSLPTGAPPSDSPPSDSAPTDSAATHSQPSDPAPPTESVPPTEELRSAIETANRRLRGAIAAQPALAGMGTTLTALLIAPDKLILGHVGDSRAYLLRADTLTQITRDDTLVQNLIDQGKLTEEQARVHPHRAVIMHALSGDAVEADISVRIPEVGDRYLLSSDGLNAAASATEIRGGLRVPEAQAAADRLVQIAMDGGGPDNISVIVIDIVPSGPAAPPDSSAERTNPAGETSDVVEAGAITELADLLPVFNASPEAVERLGRGETSIDTVVSSSSGASQNGVAGTGVTGTAPPSTGSGGASVAHVATDGGHRAGRPRHPRRTAAISSLGVLVIVAALFGVWRWTQAQYFVAADRQHKVTVYRGVHQTLAGYRLYHRVATSPMTLEDLLPAARTQVSAGISATSRRGAEAILANLRVNQQLPLCPTLTTTPPGPSTPPSAPAPMHASASRQPRPAHTSGSLKTHPNPSGGTPVPRQDCR